MSASLVDKVGGNLDPAIHLYDDCEHVTSTARAESFFSSTSLHSTDSKQIDGYRLCGDAHKHLFFLRAFQEETQQIVFKG